MPDETLSKAMTDDLSSVVNDERMRLYKSTGFSEMPIYPLLVKGVVLEFWSILVSVCPRYDHVIYHVFYGKV